MSEFHPMPSRAFLTGATGFVGAAVARALLAQGCSVVTLVRPVQPANAASAMLVMLSGRVMLVRPVQPENALSPMLVTPPGMI